MPAGSIEIEIAPLSQHQIKNVDSETRLIYKAASSTIMQLSRRPRDGGSFPQVPTVSSKIVTENLRDISTIGLQQIGRNLIAGCSGKPLPYHVVEDPSVRLKTPA